MLKDNLFLIIKRVISSAGIMSVGKIIQLIVLLLAAKEMGVREFGAFSIALAIAQFSTFIFIPGGQQGVTKIVTRFFSSKRYQDLSSAIIFYILIFLLVTTLVIFSNQVTNKFNFEEIKYISNLLVLLIPITIWTIIREGISRGFSYVVISQAPHELVSPMLILCILIFSNGFFLSAYDFALIWFLSYMLIEIVLVTTLVFLNFKSIKKISLNFNIRDWLDDLIIIQISNLTRVCILRTDIIATGIILGVSEAGLYSIAQRLAQPITLIARTIFAATGYLVTKFFEQKNFTMLYQNLLITTIFALITGILYVLVVFIAGETFLKLVDEAYLDAFPILVVLCVALFFDCLSSPSNQFLLICGFPKMLIKVNIVGIIAYLLIIFFPIVNNLLVNIALAVLIPLSLISIFCMLFSHISIRKLIKKSNV